LDQRSAACPAHYGKSTAGRRADHPLTRKGEVRDPRAEAAPAEPRPTRTCASAEEFGQQCRGLLTSTLLMAPYTGPTERRRLFERELA
jgi:hypothetical protein